MFSPDFHGTVVLNRTPFAPSAFSALRGIPAEHRDCVSGSYVEEWTITGDAGADTIMVARNLAGCVDFAVRPNQQYRVEIPKPPGTPFSIEPGDVLATVLRTRPGDLPARRPISQVFDLSSFAGSTVRLRFAEVDNLSMFPAGVDAVVITSRP
jgi:hypothetical protein